MRLGDTRQKPAYSRKACLRCRRSKRKCDRVLPKCLLCTRRKDECQYETITLTSSSAGPSVGIKPISPLNDGLSCDHIRAAVVERLSGLKPSDVETAYSRNIRPWFPIIAESKLVTQLPNSWDDKALDFTLLSLSIVLFSTAPNPKGCGDANKFGIMDLYLSVKSWIALVEGLGMNSMELVQARLVIVAFEVFHGFYPAAYISIGAVVRAAETLKTGRDLEAPSYKPRTEQERVEELTTWAAIKILDRYIAAECGETPPVTRRIYNKDPDLPYSELPFAVCPVLLSAPLSPQRQFLRLYEATNLLDKVHLAFYEPTPRMSFNLEEGALLVRTLSSLKTVILEEAQDGSRIYSSGLHVCNIGLLLIHGTCDKAKALNYNIKEEWMTAALPMTTVIEDIYDMVHSFVVDEDDLDRIPPFVNFLLYKAASIVTVRLRDQLNFEKNTQMLKSLRVFLDRLNTRWLTAGRFIALLDEDTTPRIFKALERV
ncbi:hypothetical protein M419DRAFT_91228 [Trichoderma reesei RUT C-30]|uniref:Zn(2)-C6 fungal-type domain-containing protein n=1 Tax=Hypocrea jecorina (strain ATCC 56765 / BCRC 32924 / NRRL 11460 / Rut C-30) TaxID=1344414 RepID=A0A024RX08_HYPJR|nr:hypothetical protein M419DRAFT_91228 [Trichoderma reesei RUT C-30]